MAVEKLNLGKSYNKSEYKGLSTDTKPTDCDTDSTFYELDTKKSWVFSSKNINPITSNGWWEK